MALKMRKDIKKSSYYVWFLGAKESKGLRGKEFIVPVIEHLVQREKDIEPFKVTLQISHKGLKIIQTVLSTNPKTSKPKNETIKHFIPHNTITCVTQDEDIVSCILLLFNPVTKCPLHVHVYRCDSVETASLLRGQLETLIERPENQKKFSDLENRVKPPPKEKKKFESSLGSDTGTSTRESESSEERYSSGETRIATLYDSLAAELRQKLGNTESPILLPPRDYDTVHRQKGNLQGIDLRRCLNTSIVGQNAKGGRRIESSGGSSGIGSDHAPSPESPESGDRFNMLDNQSTSDEEWNAEPNDSTLYLMHGASDMILPRASRHGDPTKFSPEPPKSPDYRPDARFNRYPDPEQPKYHEKPPKESSSKYPDNKRYERYEPPLPETLDNPKYHQRYHDESEKYPRKYETDPRRPDNGRYQESGYKNRSSRYHEDFDEDVEYREKRAPKEEMTRSRSKYVQEEPRYYPEEKLERARSSKYDDYYQQKQVETKRYYEPELREKIRSKYPTEDPRFYTEYEDKPRPTHEYYNDSQKPKYIPEERQYYQETKTLEKTKKFNPEDPRFYTDSRHSEKSSRSKYSSEEIPRPKYTPEEIPRPKYSQEEYFEDVTDTRRRPEDRQRSPTPPEINVSPRDRFKDAKEKFLLLERERVEEQERLRRSEMTLSSPNLKDKTFLKRHESMVHPKDRYHEERRYEPESRYQPKAAPRTMVEEEVRYRREVPLDRYRSPERYEKNRRSMYNQIEEEHKKNSNEIAKELKRRSYMEPNYEKDYYPEKSYRDEPKRYPGMERDAYQFSKSNVELDKVGEKYDPNKYSKTQKLKQPAGYRHSYAEPKLSLEKAGKKHYPEMVHRTNSSVSNSGRVGIASVNPY